MSKVSHASRAASPEVGSLVKMRYGAVDVVATVLEDRGPLGREGRRLVRVTFLREGTGDPIETEIPADELRVVAPPGWAELPASKRVGVEAVGDTWVGTYTAPDGRVAVITEEVSTSDLAKSAAMKWLDDARTEPRTVAYEWKPDPHYPGRYSVFRKGRLGDELVRESA